MSNLLRRLGPALALGGTAVAIVTLFDPGVKALAGGHSDAAIKPAKASSGDGSATLTQPKASPSAGTDTAPTPQAEPTPAPQPTTQAASDCSNAPEVKGPVAQTRFGPVQVVARVAGGTVCSADAVQYPDGDGRSYEISQYSIPLLNEQAVSQNGQISGVSGASYTSYGYAQSLQAILQKAN